MKIADLFVAIGFDIKNKKELDEVTKALDKAHTVANKVALGFGVVNLAILAMAETAAKAGMALRNFAVTTGLSTDELQLWQHAAVVNGVQADTLKASILSLQSTAASFALGTPQAVGAWSLLGINPTQDPVKVISDLRKRLLNEPNKGVARALLANVGLEGLAPIVMGSNAQYEKWSRSFIVTPEQIDRLQRLSAAWESLKWSVISAKNQFASVLAPVLEKILNLLEGVAEIAVRHRGALAIGAGIFLALGAAVTAVAAALGGLSAIVAVIPLLPLIGPLARILWYIGLITAVVIGLGLVLDDVITSLSGGDAITRRLGEWLAEFKAIQDVVNGIWDIWGSLSKVMHSDFDAKTKVRLGIMSILQPTTDYGRNMMQAAGITNNIELKVDGSSGPAREVATEVVEIIGSALTDAYRQAGAYNY